MWKFPADAPTKKVVKTLERLGFTVVREGNHISMIKENPDGTEHPLQCPIIRHLKNLPYEPSLPKQEFQKMSFLKHIIRNFLALKLISSNMTLYQTPKTWRLLALVKLVHSLFQSQINKFCCCQDLTLCR